MVCVGYEVDIKLELTKSPTNSPDRKKKRLVAYISSVSKLDHDEFVVTLWVYVLVITQLEAGLSSICGDSLGLCISYYTVVSAIYQIWHSCDI